MMCCEVRLEYRTRGALKELLQTRLGPRVTAVTTISVCGFLLIMEVLLVLYNPSLTPKNYLGVIFVAAYAGWFLKDAVTKMRARKPS